MWKPMGLHGLLQGRQNIIIIIIIIIIITITINIALEPFDGP
jgi:hypothetical protein